MTNVEFHIGLDQEIQRVGSFQNDSFLPEEKDHWLNKAVDTFISVRLNSDKKPGQIFEGVQEDLDDLRGLIKTEKIATFTGPGLTSPRTADLPVDYRHYLSCRFKGVYCNDDIEYSCRLMSSDDFYYTLTNPFLRPKVYSPILRIKESKVEVYFAKDVLPRELTLDYLKKPALIDGANNPNVEYTDIPEHAHEAIIGIAARRMSQSIQPMDYNLKVQENILNKDI